MMAEVIRAAFIVAALLAFSHLAQAQREFRSSPRFEPPAENYRGSTSLDTLQDLLERKNFNDAAIHIETLLKSHADEITSRDERSFTSISNWLDVIAQRNRESIK